MGQILNDSACGCGYQMKWPMDNIECFKCHNIGHMAHDCNLTWALTQARTMQKKKVTQVWRRKEIQSESPLSSPANNICHWPKFENLSIL